MKTIWNENKIESLLKDFYQISHVRVGLFDTDGKELFAYPQELSLYCKAIRTLPEGCQACLECDCQAYRQVSSKNELYIYSCHAGLAEMVVPIRGHGKIAGYLMMGQFRLTTDTEDTLHQLRPHLDKLGVWTDHLWEYYAKLPVLDMELTKAYAHILQACASYVWMNEYIRIQQGTLGFQIYEYLLRHLDQKIQISDLMDEFKLGKTTLSKVVKEEHGMTIMELLSSLRMAEAKRLLHNSSLSVMEIARQVGIHDYNYFSKLFRHATGMTPTEYRRNNL